jgi:TolB-like protein
MAELFISYKAEDRTRVARLVTALEADGLSVWWDARIGGGMQWRDLIEQELDVAQCVIVVWSNLSVGKGGHFVRDEASRAHRRGVYLPVRIDAVEPPLGFGEIQALPLIGWKGNSVDPRFQAVVAAARAVIDHRPLPTGTTPFASQKFRRRTALASGGLLMVGALGVGGWALRGGRTSANDKRIAVMPFSDLSGDANQAYFASGITEDLRDALGRLLEMEVIGRISSEKMRNADATEVAKKLGVSNILIGSVRRSASLVRISAQLIDGTNGVERWSQTYDRAPSDMLSIQGAIANSIASTLSIRLGTADKAGFATGETRNPEARDLFFKARTLLQSGSYNDDNIRRALAMFAKVVAIDPKYARAFAALALTQADLAFAAKDVATLSSGLASAMETARHAIILAPQSPHGHWAQAFLSFWQLNFKVSFAAYRRARAAQGFSFADYSFQLACFGRFDEAISEAVRARLLDPLSPMSYSIESYALFLGRRYDHAIIAARKCLDLAPEMLAAHGTIGASLYLLGQYKKAFDELTAMPPTDVDRQILEAIFSTKIKSKVESDAKLAIFAREAGDTVDYQYATIYAQRNEPERAFTALDRAFANRDPGLSFLRVDRFLDPLRSDPRFKALEGKLEFP